MSFFKPLLFLFCVVLFWQCEIPPGDLAGSATKQPMRYKHNLTIILDRAHGNNTAGKASPDGRHKEWMWSDRWVKVLGAHLSDIGFTVVFSVPETTEPGLNERVRRMNKVASPAFVISLHNNAAGMGEWKNAQGYSFWTTPGKTKSDSCATILFTNFRLFLPDLPFRQDLTDGDPDYEARFTVLYSKHPSVLIEYLFQDNKLDLELIENPHLSHTIIEIIDLSLLQIERYLVYD